MIIRKLTTLFCTLAIASSVQAQSGEIQISHPFAHATVAQQTSGGAYLTIENKGKEDDKLMKVESPVAKSTELHLMEMTNDVMRMREVDSIALNAGKKIAMEPGGGYHIMLIGLKQRLKAGEKFPLTLYFEKAGKTDVVVHVAERNSASHQH